MTVNCLKCLTIMSRMSDSRVCRLRCARVLALTFYNSEKVIKNRTKNEQKNEHKFGAKNDTSFQHRSRWVSAETRLNSASEKRTKKRSKTGSKNDKKTPPNWTKSTSKTENSDTRPQGVSAHTDRRQIAVYEISAHQKIWAMDTIVLPAAAGALATAVQKRPRVQLYVNSTEREFPRTWHRSCEYSIYELWDIEWRGGGTTNMGQLWIIMYDSTCVCIYTLVHRY